MIKNFLKNSERGQAIILIAFAIIGMVAVVGLMTDGGILLIENARLKRGIDAASVAAALQFRKGFQTADLEAAARELLLLNQSEVSDIKVATCDTVNSVITDPTELASIRPQLCTTPSRKLIYVKASRVVNFGFMRILGPSFNSTTITAASIGEAASIDLVLVMDTSSSMAFETNTNPGSDPNGSDPGPAQDPALCNGIGVNRGAGGTCQPMQKIKQVAENFINTMFFPYDRVAIVTMTSQNAAGFRDPETKLALSGSSSAVVTALRDITVYQPPACDSQYGVCRNLCKAADIAAALPGDPCDNKPVGYYVGLNCPIWSNITPNNPSSCNSSNVGGALLEASTVFGDRKDSFWVAIALVGGPANATNGTGDITDGDANGYPDDPYAFGYCPSSTWPFGPGAVNPFCRDASATSRHSCVKVGTIITCDPAYDADDYARDQADFLSNRSTGQGVTTFTIGLGNLIQHANKGDPDAGEKLLQYIARNAGDIPGVPANHGEYYYSPDANGLSAIFASIAKNIFTRISK